VTKDEDNTPEEVVAQMQYMMSVVKTLNQLITFCDFDSYLDSVDEAEVMLPILDPTAYMKTDHGAVTKTVKLVKMYKEVQDYLRSLTPMHNK